MHRRLLPSVLFLLAVAPLAPSLARAEDPLHLPIGDPARREREAPLTLDAITDAKKGDLLTPADLPARLAGVRILLIGESHTSMDSHQIERRVLEELHRAGRKVAIGLEMFPYTEQASLDLWLGGKLSETEFLQQSHWYKNWGYNWNYYREVFLLAGQSQIQMFAINTPREVVSAVRKKGFAGLTEEEKTHIPVGRQWELEATWKAASRVGLGRFLGRGRVRTRAAGGAIAGVERHTGQSRIYAALGTRSGSCCSGSRKRISKGEARGPWPGLPRGGWTAARWTGVEAK